MMRARRRWAVVAAFVVAVATVAFLWPRYEPGVSLGNFKRLRLKTSLSRAERILGPCSERVGNAATWQNGDLQIAVLRDERERIAVGGCYNAEEMLEQLEVDGHEPSWLENWLDWLGIEP